MSLLDMSLSSFYLVTLTGMEDSAPLINGIPLQSRL